MKTRLHFLAQTNGQHLLNSPSKPFFQSFLGLPYKPFQQTHLHSYNAILLSKEIAHSGRRIGATVGRQRDGHSTRLSRLPFAASGFSRRNQHFFIPLFELSFAVVYYASHLSLSSSLLHFSITVAGFHLSSSLASRIFLTRFPHTHPRILYVRVLKSKTRTTDTLLSQCPIHSHLPKMSSTEQQSPGPNSVETSRLNPLK